MDTSFPLPPQLEQFRSVDERVAAPIVGVSLSSLRNWRVAGKGPPYRKIGRKVAYVLTELLTWRDAQKVNPR